MPPSNLTDCVDALPASAAGIPAAGTRLRPPITQSLSSLVRSAHRLFVRSIRSVLSPYWILPAAIVATGCTRSIPSYINDAGAVSSYLDRATKVSYPDVEIPSLNEVSQSHAPITVIDPDFHSYYDLTLEDAVSYALNNAKILRGYGTPGLQNSRVIPGIDNVINSPNAPGTMWNIAVRETEPGFIGVPGQVGNPSGLLTNTGLDVNQGVESALADFDAYYASSFNFTKSDEPRNTVATNPLSPIVFQQDQFTWQSEVGKKSANGTQIFFRNANSYLDNNNPLAPGGLQVLDSWYRTSFEAEFRQPLLRGRGEFINRMPIIVSRIGTDQEIANLEAQLQNFVTNIEIRYWDLYLAYRNLDAAKKGRDAAMETWKIVDDQFREGAEVNVQQVAQATQQYYLFNSQVAEAFNQVLIAQGQLRFLLGWSSTDGTILRPVDEPVMAQIEFSWCESLCEALTYRPELRQVRWEIKKRELALAYAKNGLLPELNATALYRWLGLGNRFGTSDSNPNPFPNQSSAALNELFDGDYQEMSVGLDFRMPIGYRRELANVRNAQLKLAREIGRLEDSELDATKELTEAFQALALNQQILQYTYDRWRYIKIEEAHFLAIKDAGVEKLDVALDAQQRLAQAEVAFYTALTEYNKAISLIHRRKGTSLAYCGIEFSEGPWSGKAYLDAQEHARRRAASRHVNYGWTRPQVISRGEQWTPDENVGFPVDARVQPTVISTQQPGQMVPESTFPLEGETILPSDSLQFESMPQPSTTRFREQPTPAVRESSQVRPSTSVTTVGYEEVIDATKAAYSGSFNANHSQTSPVRTSQNAQNQTPAFHYPRDNVQPLSQATLSLTGNPENPSSANASLRTEGVRPTSTQANTTTPASVDWNRMERLGFDRPKQAGNGNTAQIQIRN